MKANEAPKKIYISLRPSIFGGHVYTTVNKDFPDAVEYTSTDSFIEKACEFIRKGGKRGDAYIVTEFGEEVFDFVQFSEDFIAHIKGE